jgi:chaperone modulatory protein CbpM
MREDDIVIGTLLDESWLTLEQVAATCQVDTDWLQRRIDEGLVPQPESVCGIWRLSGGMVARIRRTRQFERDFDAVPELAALVADLLEEMDRLRGQLKCLRPSGDRS